MKKTKRIPKILSVLTTVILAVSMLPPQSFAEETGSDSSHHYFVFASDLHADPDHLFENARSVFSGMVKGFPEEIDFFSLLGDIAGDGDTAPEYKASEIYGAAAESLQKDDWHLMEQYFSVICSDHDVNVDRDVHASEFLKNDASEQVFRGITHDGITYGYVYGIGFNGMAKGGIFSKESADLFKHWIRNKDTTIPVLVVSHLPIQALCGDNPGASYWNEALNYAATGVEGITGEDDSHPIIRNVIFLSGHNHIKDETEYVFPAGTKMPVQADTTLEESEDGDNPYSSIYYTSITPGYIGSNGNATLVDISDDSITFTKYHNGSEVSLGTDGVTGERLESSLSIHQFKRDDEGGPVITKQPENAIVSYPDGAEFSVEVEEPDKVSSYQWYMLDQEDQLFRLDGSSASTNTLVLPSTQQRNNVLRFYCMITDKDGLRTVTRQAILDMDNRYDDMPVFYIGEYALKPGESLDLSEVDIGDGFKLGSGRVSFDSNATDITIENLDFNNAHTRCGLAIAPNVGLDMECHDPEQDEFNVIFTGENHILNTYFDYDYNAGGIPFDFCITGDGEKPLVNLIGDGTLTITNGFNAIRVIGDLMIGVDITVNQNRPEYADGIAANHILVSEGRKLDLTVNGFAFNAKGNLFMKDAEVSILANTPHISQGTVTKSTLSALGAISLENTKLNVKTVSDQAVCGNTAGNIVIDANGELFITKGSEVNCETQVKGENFANWFTGINTLNGEIQDSSVSVKMDAEDCMDSMGLYADEDFLFINSELKVDLHTGGTVYGVYAERDFSAEDSNVDVNAGTYSDFDGDACYGLVCENAVFKATDQKYAMKFTAEDGMAVVCDPGRESSKTPVGYEEGYESANFYLRDDIICLTPEEYAFSLSSIPFFSDDLIIKYAVIETVYDTKDTTKPAETVVFGLEKEDKTCPKDDTCPMTPFTDTDRNAWYHDGVHWALEKSVMNGTGDNTFEPMTSTTRAMLVTMLWRMEGSPVVNYQMSFKDVPDDQWYTEAIRWAASTGIVYGYDEETFGTNKNITREQLATILYRSAQAKGSGFTGGWAFPLLFDDANQVSDWANEAMHWMVVNGVINGVSDTELSPGSDAVRAQVATMLMRFSEKVS